MPWLGTPAYAAEDASRDVELVRPEFSEGAVAGVDTPRIGERGSVRAGTLVMYERQPVVYVADGAYAGDVVRDRLIATTGVTAAVSRRVAAQLVLPLATQGGGTGDLAPAGPALGDLEAGVRVLAFRSDTLAVGPKASLALPLGTADAWMGEPYPRLTVGGLAEVEIGTVSVLVDVAPVLRADLGPVADYTTAATLDLGVAVRYEPPSSDLAFATALVGRTGLGPTLGGVAETPAEMLATLLAGRDAAISGTVGLGVGLTGGVGAARWRALAGVSWAPPRQPERWRVVVPDDVEEDTCAPAVVVEEEEEGERTWDEDELVRAEREEIVVRDPILFRLGTDEILPESLPTLVAMAKLLREDADIRGVLVEGHASEDGSHAYNFDLSDRRARAIFRALVEGGVQPERLSYRGMGEVAPAGGGGSADRRVIFRIVARSLTGVPAAPGPVDVVVPWTGETVHFDGPAPPPPFTLEEEE
ncbi:MAG: OmpA family protein [Myxococcota bacterium]